MSDAPGTRHQLRTLSPTEEFEESWQKRRLREQELDANGFADDDLVPLWMGEMEAEYSEEDHKALVAAAKDGSATAIVKMAEANRGFRGSHKPLSETPHGNAETVPQDYDDRSLEAADDE